MGSAHSRNGREHAVGGNGRSHAAVLAAADGRLFDRRPAATRIQTRRHTQRRRHRDAHHHAAMARPQGVACGNRARAARRRDAGAGIHPRDADLQSAVRKHAVRHRRHHHCGTHHRRLPRVPVRSGSGHLRGDQLDHRYAGARADHATTWHRHPARSQPARGLQRRRHAPRIVRQRNRSRDIRPTFRA